MMYCSNCGEKLDQNVKFCSSCGHRINSGTAQKERSLGDTFVIRPVFNSTAVLGRYLPLIIFFTIWSGGFLGGFSMVLFDSFGLPAGSSFVLFGVAVLVLAPAIIYFQTKKNYEKTTYEFLPDRLIYFDGFWNRTKKELKYKAITEIGYNEGILQRNFNLGDLILSTPATNKKSGLRLTDIENIEEVYNKFKKNYDTIVA